MNKKTKKQQVKEWIGNHKDSIFCGIMCGTAAVIGFKIGEKYFTWKFSNGFDKFYNDGFIKLTLPSGEEPANLEEYMRIANEFYDKK